MNELFNKNRFVFTEADEDLKLNAKLFAAAALNPFIEHLTSPRGLMMSGHIAQNVVLNEPEENIIQTGLEYEFGKYTISKIIEEPSEVISVIKRYRTLDNNPTNVVERIVIYRELDTGIVNCVRIPYFNTYHPYFGFKYDVNDRIDDLVRGDILDAETILVKPPTLKDNGGYGFGKDVNVALMTLPDVDEDGFVVSESFCEKFKFKIFEKRTIEVGENSFLLNIYGDENHYKPFPEIGERINETGTVAVAREYDPLYGPGLYSKKALREFNPIFDKAVYVRGEGGKIVDIKTYYNPKRKKALPTGTDELCKKYSDLLVSFYEQVIQVYEGLNSEYRRTFGNELTVGNTFNNLLVEAYSIVESSRPNTRLKKMYRKETLDLYRIEFVIEYEYKLGVKNKITDMSGGKGVIVQVFKDEDMPIDKAGNRADVIMDPKSTISRNNVGRLYERYTKASMVIAEKMIKDIFYSFNKESVYELTKEQVKVLFNIVLNYVSIIESIQYAYYKKAYDSDNIEAMMSVLDEAINDKFRIYLTVDNDKRKYEIVNDIKQSEFKPIYDTVTYTYHGKQVETVKPIFIAPMYIMLLSKIADTTLSTSSAKLNHFGLPIVVSKFDKYSLPYRNSPVRVLGETEGRLFASYGGRKFLAELRDINVSIKSHGMVYEKILKTDKPTNIDKLIDRKKHPYGTERGLEILNSLWNSIGMELKYVEDKQIYYPPIDDEDVIVTDIDKVSDITEIDLDNRDKGIEDE